MQQYDRREGTPLKFHKYFWYFICPVNFLAVILNLILEIPEIQFFHWLYVVDIVYFILILALVVMCFVGFFGWKPYAWYGVMAYFCVCIVYGFLTVIAYALYVPDEVGLKIGQLLGMLIYAFLVGIYYLKRRPLFFQSSAEAAAENRYSPAGAEQAIAAGYAVPSSVQAVAENGCRLSNAEPTSAAGYAVPPSIQFCRKCGHKLRENSLFCNRCGVKVLQL